MYIFYFAAPIPIVPPPNWPLEDWPPTLQPKTKGIDKDVQVKPSICDGATETTLELFDIPKPLPKPKTRKFGTQTNSGGTENTAITDKLLKSNRKCLVYCGIPLSFLKMILEVLEGKAYKYEKLSLADQVVLFYHKCKTNLTNGCLAIEFNVTEDKVSAVFEHIEFALFDHAKDSIYWLTREQNQKLMPEAFKKEYPNCIGILDACEVRTECPGNVRQSVLMWSTYKHGFTIKFLICIAPCGQITFVSRGYGGRTTDTQITIGCGVIDKVEPGDTLMMDKVRYFKHH